MAIVLDGTAGITTPALDSTARFATGDMPLGSVLQVVSTTKTDAFSASVVAGSTTSVTGFSASITPTSTTSKILVLVSLTTSLDTSSSDNNTVRARLLRGATAIGTGDAAGGRARVTTAGNGFLGTGNAVQAILGFNFLDTPNTNAAITYTVDLSSTSSTTRTIFVNRTGSDIDSSLYQRSVSTITLMEIAA